MTRDQKGRVLLDAGLSLLPIASTGEKRPAQRWKRFQQRAPRLWEVRSWLRRGDGLGVVAGAVSGGLEVLDFDEGPYFWHWAALVQGHDPDALDGCPLIESPSGGYHLYYRCETIEGNLKLAHAAAWDAETHRYVQGKTRIETRGEGGYVLSPLCPGACHPTGHVYQLLRGSLRQIPMIAPARRTLFLDCARAFTETIEPPRQRPLTRTAPSTDRPGDVFAATHTWEDILMPYGWMAGYRSDGCIYWRRPGKHGGQSATTGYEGHEVFYVFSSNAAPFEPQRGYGKFYTYVLLAYRGDFSAAARALAGRKAS